MNFIERYKGSYRAYFEHYQNHEAKLNKGQIIQLILAFLLMTSISAFIGVITQNIESFSYVYFSLAAILIITSLLFTYFASGYDNKKTKGIYLFPWLKWLIMFLWYQIIVLEKLYVELVSTRIILILAIYFWISIILFYFTEKKLGIKSNMISKTISTMLLLYIGHNVFLHIIPVVDITLSYVLVLISLGFALFIKHIVDNFDFKFLYFFRSKLFRLVYFTLIVSLFITLSIKPEVHQKYGFSLFNHETIFKYEVNVEKQKTFGDEQISQIIATKDYVYVKTDMQIYILDNDLVILNSFKNDEMDLIETNLGIMLIKHHDQIDDRFYFTLYEFELDGSITYYMTNYVVKQKQIYYIYFDDVGIYYLLPFHESGVGYITYYNGSNFNVFDEGFLNHSSEKHILVQEDDIIIGYNESGLFGVHRKYGTYIYGFQSLENGTDQFYIYEEIIHDFPFEPHAYGYNHTIYRTTRGLGYLYHYTFDSDILSAYLEQFLVSDKIFVNSDGSIYNINKFHVVHYDGYFNLISKHYIDGINVDHVYTIQLTDERMFYIIDNALYTTDLMHVGSYNIIQQKSPYRFIGILGFGFMFMIWKTYTIRPDQY